jgi:hypothetical protein
MNAITKVLTLQGLCIVSIFAFAQSSPQAGGMGATNPRQMERMAQQLQTRFANANATHDGKLTREQASAGMPMVAEHFDEIDAQHLGYVTLSQIAEFVRREADH